MEKQGDSQATIGPAVKKIQIVDGDILSQNVDVIVNPWNRNLIPWWLLIPRGVSGAIKRKAGVAPYMALRKYGLIPLGGAIVTASGRLSYKAIIHVAGINMLWRASSDSISGSVLSAMKIVNDRGYASVAFPLIGSGSGGFSEDASLEIILSSLNMIDFDACVTLVKYKKSE